MITLLTYPPAFGRSSASPFGVKAEWLLNMSGMDWERENHSDPRKLPRQKLPAVRVDGRIIPDSDEIRAYLEAKGADFDTGLTDRDKAVSRAFIRMAEEHMYFHVVMDRWVDDRVWPIIRDAFFGMMPRAVRGFATGPIRKKCIQGLHFQGLGRLDEQQRLARIEPDLAAITTMLAGQDFLFGDAPTAADASVAAMLGNLAATPVETALQQRIAQDVALTAYVARCTAAMGQTKSTLNTAV